ncbi:hypothetical protein GCM10027051_16040 [Niabella terrae]
MKKGIVYQRYSTDDQSQHSFERQDLIVNNWTKLQGVTILETFRDKGLSGRTFNRPDMHNLMNFIRKNYKVADFLIVSELSRFSRDAGEAISLVQEIQAHYDIQIVSASRGAIYDCTDSNSFFMMGLEFLLGNSENIKRQSDINGGIYAAKTQKGKWIQGGPAPFGFRKVMTEGGRVLQVDEDEARIIRYIFTAYAEKVPVYLIKQHAKSMGMRKKGSDPINEIIRNPLYMGFQRVKPWKGQPGGLFRIKDLPAIIEPDTWHAVEYQRAKATKQQHTILSEDFPLRGVVSCECGNKLTGAYSTGRGGRKYAYYKCHGHKNINAGKLHSQVALIWEYLSIPHRLVKEIQKTAPILLKGRTAAGEKQMQSLQVQLRILDGKISSLEEKFITSQIEQPVYAKWKQEFGNARTKILDDIKALKKQRSRAQMILEAHLTKLADLRYIWDRIDVIGKRKMLKAGFDNTLVYSEDGCRTAFLPPFLRHNAMEMNKQGILKIPNIFRKSGEVEATGLEPVSKHIP